MESGDKTTKTEGKRVILLAYNQARREKGAGGAVCTSLGKGERVDEENDKILLCTFFCNSVFPSWFLIKINEARKMSEVF